MGWSYFTHFDLFIPRVLPQHELLSLSAMSQMRGSILPKVTWLSETGHRVGEISLQVLQRVPMSQGFKAQTLRCVSPSMQQEGFLSGVFVRIKDDV